MKKPIGPGPGKGDQNGPSAGTQSETGCVLATTQSEGMPGLGQEESSGHNLTANHMKHGLNPPVNSRAPKARDKGPLIYESPTKDLRGMDIYPGPKGTCKEREGPEVAGTVTENGHSLCGGAPAGMEMSPSLS